MSARRVACALALLALGASAAADVSLRVEVDAAEVASGRAFELRVVRSWSDDLLPRAVDDDAWRPLFVQPLGGPERHASDGTTTETQRYRAWIFGDGEWTLVPPPFEAVPREGGARERAEAEPVALRVRSALADDDGPVPELPGGPVDGPLTAIALVQRAGAALLLVAGALVVARRVRRPAPPAPDADATTHAVAPSAPQVDPSDVALAALDALRARAADAGTSAAEAFATALSDALRAWAAARFSVATRERTRQEIDAALRATSAAPDAARTALGVLLLRCDAVRFGRAPSSVSARLAWIDDASACVRAARGQRDAEGAP